ncbi:MAG: branched-chain amino acid ABC transporter permease [Chloroflexota bacterium]
MSFLTDAIIIGLIDAAPLVLAAVGFTLIYYLNGFINVAYAENVTLGAYFAVIFNAWLGLNFFVSIIPAALLTGLLSVLTYLLVFRPAFNRGVGATELIILSVGLSFFLRYAAILIFSNDPLVMDVGYNSYLSIFGQGITSVQITALTLVAASAFALYFFIYNTNYGEMMRGLANNEDLAMVSGINPMKVSILIWFIAGIAGGMGGIFFGVFSLVTPRVGWNQILIIIMISIVGGIGSVRGALLASVGAGILTAAVTLLTKPLYAQVILLIFFIGILKARKVWG